MQTPEERFKACIDIRGPIECWNWKKPTHHLRGYAKLHFQGKRVYAHRVAMLLTGVKIPPGICVCHRCDNPKCCNPAHLFLATTQENTADKVAKNRHTKGDTHVSSKLTECAVKNIRALRAAGFHDTQLAKMFCISAAVIRGVCYGRQWKHVSGALPKLPRERRFFVNYEYRNRRYKHQAMAAEQEQRQAAAEGATTGE